MEQVKEILFLHRGSRGGGLTSAGTAPLTGIITTNSALSILMFYSLRGKSMDLGVPDGVAKLSQVSSKAERVSKH